MNLGTLLQRLLRFYLAWDGTFVDFIYRQLIAGIAIMAICIVCALVGFPVLWAAQLDLKPLGQAGAYAPIITGLGVWTFVSLLHYAHKKNRENRPAAQTRPVGPAFPESNVGRTVGQLQGIDPLPIEIGELGGVPEKLTQSRRNWSNTKAPGRWRMRCAKLLLAGALWLLIYPPWAASFRTEEGRIQGRMSHTWIWASPYKAMVELYGRANLDKWEKKGQLNSLEVSIDKTRLSLEVAALILAGLLVHPNCPLWPVKKPA